MIERRCPALTNTPESPGNAPRRVVRVITRLNVGGPSIHVQLLGRGLRRRGYDTRLVVGRVSPDEGEMPLEDGVGQVSRCPFLRREPAPFCDLRALWWCYRLFRRTRPTIVHTHHAKAGFIGRTAAWLAGVPIVLHTFHGHTFRGYFTPRRARAFIRLERWLARRTTRLIAISPRIRDELAHEFRIAPPDKIAVVPLGLDLDDFRDAERFGGQLRQRLGVPAGTPLIGIVGRLTPVKNHEMFLLAARRIHEHRPDAHFVVIGDGELRPRLESRAERLGLGRAVHFLGWMPRSPAIYADLDLLALTSHNEGTPVAVIEAMAAARPCVATNVGGVADVIDDGVTGRVAPPDDPAAFADVCLEILNDADKHQSMADRARESSHRYNHERLCRDVAKLYDELIAERLPLTDSPGNAPR